MLSGGIAHAQLNGTYSINAGAAASATNYTSVTAAVSDLVSGTRSDGGPINGPGVSGPVTLRIAAGSGPYTEQASFDAISGTSSTNTVRLTGGPTMETIQITNTTTTDRHVVRLSGSSYVILDSLTLVNDGVTYGYGVWITNNADYNTVSNCSITVSTTSTSSNFCGIAISGSSPTTTGDNGDDNTVMNNVVVGGYYGYSSNGTSSSVYSVNNHVINNQFIEYYYYGIRHYEQSGGIIRGNYVRARSSGTTAGYGMYIYYNSGFTIEQNHVRNYGTYGIYLAYTNYQGAVISGRSSLRNNFVGGTSLLGTNPYGIYVTTNGHNNDIFHNSVSITAASGLSRCLYILAGSGNDVRNNSFSITNSGTGYAAYVSSAAYISAMDYNNYYAPGSSNFVYVAGAYTPGTYIGGAGFNFNSQDGDPNYVDPVNDLHAYAAQLFDAGDPTVAVSTDYDGDARPHPVSSIPDIGADEYLPDSLDVSPLALPDPTDYSCPDSFHVVRVVIGNRGLNTVTGFPVSASITGAVTANLSVNYTGSLPLGGIDTVVVGTFSSWPGGAITVSATTGLSGDQSMDNDTLSLSRNINLTPSSPTANGANICAGDSVQLTASGTGTTYWFDAPNGGNQVASGAILNTGPLGSSTNYYVEARGTAPGNVLTTFANNNSCGGGNMFDLTPNVEITIDSFDLNVSGSATVDVYYKVGTHLGFETNGTAWTLLGSGSVVGAGTGNPSRLVVGGLTIPAGQTYAIYIYTTTIVYTTLAVATTYSSPELNLTAGTGLCGLFSGTNFPRGWNGRLYYTAEGCGSPRTPVAVTVDPSPVVNLQDSSYCGQATLDAGSGGTSYNWSNGATSQTTTVSSSGTYSVMVTNSFSCSATDSANIVILPLPVVNLGNDTTLCNGASMTLDAGNPGGTYSWSTSSTSQTINVNSAGTYSVQVTNTDGCQAGDNIVVATNITPAGTASANTAGCPTIAFTGNTTGGNPTTTSWDFGDGNTGTGLSPSHTYTANGQYTVTFTQTNDCGTSTSTTTIDINCVIGIDDPAAGHVSLFPNPTAGVAELQLDLPSTGVATVLLTDLSGKVIFNRTAEFSSGTSTILLDLGNLSTGMYVVRVMSETLNWQGRLIRE